MGCPNTRTELVEGLEDYPGHIEVFLHLELIDKYPQK